MRALLTGGAGFVGQWLARSLLARGDHVDLAGLGRALEGPPILTADERGATRWLTADVQDAEALDAAIEASTPDVVFHLAGVSFPPDADRTPTATFDVNVLGAVRLLASVSRRRASGTLDPVVLIVGSGVQYGRHEESEMPLDESAEQRPVSTYGASKAAQETIALQMFRESGVRVVCVRSFNHSGIGHGAQYLLPSLVARARGIAAGGPNRLALGNDVVRDYVHVDDVVSAYALLAERGRPGEVYNVASGRGVSARQLAADVLHRTGVHADISTDAALVRATDIPTLIGSPAKLARETGWAPRKTHLDIIDDLLRSPGAPPVTAHAAQN
jgi:GDP-4-dehydro-6-deoxy-D-mannose reductase